MTGFMGTAILRGLLATTSTQQDGDDEDNRHHRPSVRYTAWVRSRTSLQRLRRELASVGYEDDQSGKQQEQQEEQKGMVNCVCGEEEDGRDIVSTVIAPADVVILAFPPGELDAVFGDGSNGLADALRGKLTISLLAGVSCDRLMNALSRPATTSITATTEEGGRGDGSDQHQNQHHVTRAIPSIGAQIRDSVTLIAETKTHAGPEQQAVTTWLFEQLGQVQRLPESLMDEATALGAACNALAIVAVDAVVDAGVAEGISRSAAMQLAAASLRSASGLLLSSSDGGGMTPESLKAAMSVPKGITINAVLALERGGARSAVSDAVRDAIRYTRNMAG